MSDLNILNYRRRADGLGFFFMTFCFIYFANFGLIKYFLLMLPFSSLFSLVPQLLILAGLAIGCLKNIRSPWLLLGLFVIGFQGLVGVLFNNYSLGQIFLGFYAIIPMMIGFFFGSSLGQYKEDWQRVVFGCATVVAVSTIANPYISYPWSEISFTRDGIDVTASRVVGYASLIRYSGVAGNHWMAASVLFYAVCVICCSSHNLGRGKTFVLLSLYFVGLALTLNKSLVTMASLILILSFFDKNIQNKLLKLIGLGATFTSIVVCTAVMLRVDFKNYLDSSADTDWWLISVSERFNEYWARIGDTIDSTSNFVFGAGLGSSGFASIRYQGVEGLSGDLAFLHLYSNFGLLPTLGFFMILIWKLSARRLEYGDTLNLSLLVTYCVYSLTSNVIEVGCLGMLLGVAMRVSSVHSDRNAHARL